MVVELRKLKITKGIFQQLLSPVLASLLTNESLEVIGWVHYNGRYVLLYDTENKSLFRMSLIGDMKIEQRNPRIVNFMTRGYVTSVQLSGYNESNRWITRVHEIQTEAKVKGQIFI